MPVFVPLLLISSLVLALSNLVNHAEIELQSQVHDIALIEHVNVVSRLA
ncbi:MAG: hypothetical protein K8F91_10240 [Candidatus Obscuribacterales bacterium]|nr:hypothetical protein [Candidatus Obscuribacterales bacterium]